MRSMTEGSRGGRAGVVPSMHSFRHTVASRALLAGESVDEVAFFSAIGTAR